PRTLGVLIVMFLLIGLMILILVILVPLFEQQAATLMQRYPQQLEALSSYITPWLHRFGIDFELDIREIKQALMENLPAAKSFAANLIPSLKTGGLALVEFVINLVLVPVVLFYVLRDWDLMIAQIGETIPKRVRDETISMACDVDKVLGQFLRGQLSVMLLQSIFYVTGLWLVGLDFALPIGILAGLLTFVPYLGAIVGFVFATLAGLIQFQSLGGLVPVWIVFFLGQLLEGMVITPRLVGERIGLHPVLVIFSLLAFGQLFGFFGVLLALPASAALVVGFKYLHQKYTDSALCSEPKESLVISPLQEPEGMERGEGVKE
ncbi:MAG: AI-2E family transporter, partial [Gammaproteobacteria bacterium]|nr:AI-2E family transporter [Gammaproteobacteria bacterium]